MYLDWIPLRTTSAMYTPLTRWCTGAASALNQECNTRKVAETSRTGSNPGKI